MEELVLMSSVLRLSMVSLMPLLTELLSSQHSKSAFGLKRSKVVAN